jgi:hypothetical protein
MTGLSGLSLGCIGDPELDAHAAGESESEVGLYETNSETNSDANPKPNTNSTSAAVGSESCAANVFDAKYGDGHLYNAKPTPILPPGQWDWKPSDNDLANWKNFENNIGAFDLLEDGAGAPLGWELLGHAPNAIDFAGPAAYFKGSAGGDIVNLGPQGKIHSMSGGLGAGADLLVFNKSWSLDFSTSSDQGGLACDNDVVVAGCDTNADASFDIATTSIHTGSGSDVLFVRDAKTSAFDGGNLGGITSALDPDDGDDIAVFRGNMLDFRFFGGAGDDTAVWYVDEVKQASAWLGPNFFGGGGAGAALWSDAGTDRLVLVIPTNTQLISSGATQPGQLLVRVVNNYPNQPQWDAPTANDPKAKYCVTCGVGPAGKKTITLEYRSANGSVNTGYFWLTAFEELQIGVGAGAKVYSINDVAGTVTLDAGLTPTVPPALDPAYCAAK